MTGSPAPRDERVGGQQQHRHAIHRRRCRAGQEVARARADRGRARERGQQVRCPREADRGMHHRLLVLGLMEAKLAPGLLLERGAEAADVPVTEDPEDARHGAPTLTVALAPLAGRGSARAPAPRSGARSRRSPPRAGGRGSRRRARPAPSTSVGRRSCSTVAQPWKSCSPSASPGREVHEPLPERAEHALGDRLLEGQRGTARRGSRRMSFRWKYATRSAWRRERSADRCPRTRSGRCRCRARRAGGPSLRSAARSRSRTPRTCRRGGGSRDDAVIAARHAGDGVHGGRAARPSRAHPARQQSPRPGPPSARGPGEVRPMTR